MKRALYCVWFIFMPACLLAQNSWINIDSAYRPLPSSLNVFKSIDIIGGEPVVMYYASAQLKDRKLVFSADTTQGRRLTPAVFYEKNDQPLLVVNTAFFSFTTHRNLNVVAAKGSILSFNQHSVAGRGKDTLTYLHRFQGALGLSKKKKPDIAWVFSDSANRFLYASQTPVPSYRDSLGKLTLQNIYQATSTPSHHFTESNISAAPEFSKWKMSTVVGGGPVLVQNGRVSISNNEEGMFAGKAIDDRHPRTAMGYTKDYKLIIFVCEGRSEASAGLSLTQLAKVMAALGCVEAINLDGGGSTCMLINGQQTNIPSSKGEQRAIPSVFLISEK